MIECMEYKEVINIMYWLLKHARPSSSSPPLSSTHRYQQIEISWNLTRGQNVIKCKLFFLSPALRFSSRTRQHDKLETIISDILCRSFLVHKEEKTSYGHAWRKKDGDTFSHFFSFFFSSLLFVICFKQNIFFIMKSLSFRSPGSVLGPKLHCPWECKRVSKRSLWDIHSRRFKEEEEDKRRSCLGLMLIYEDRFMGVLHTDRQRRRRIFQDLWPNEKDVPIDRPRSFDP